MVKKFLYGVMVLALLAAILPLNPASQVAHAQSDDLCALAYGTAARGTGQLVCGFEGVAGDQVTAVITGESDLGLGLFGIYDENGNEVSLELGAVYTLSTSGIYFIIAIYDGGLDGSTQLSDDFTLQLVNIPAGTVLAAALANQPAPDDVLVYDGRVAGGSVASSSTTTTGGTTIDSGVNLFFDFLGWAFSGFAAISLEAYTDAPFTAEGALPLSAAGDLCATGNVVVTLDVTRLFVEDPEEADTTSIIGGDEAFLLFGIGVYDGGQPDYGFDNEFLGYYGGDLYQGNVVRSVGSVTRTVACDEIAFVSLVLFEDDSGLFGTSYIALGQPAIMPLVSSQNPSGTYVDPLPVRFYGSSTDGSYDYTITFTVSMAAN